MFVFQFSDGKYLSQRIGKAGTCLNKRHYDYWHKHGFEESFLESQLRYLEDTKTSNINEAYLFITEQSIRSSNCYSWGGTIHEVDVTIVLRK